MPSQEIRTPCSCHLIQRTSWQSCRARHSWFLIFAAIHEVSSPHWPVAPRLRRHAPVQQWGQCRPAITRQPSDSGHREEVDGNQLREVILQESAPGLRGRLAAAHHVFAHAALPDIDAKLEQLPVNTGCTPNRILPAHPADQISDLARNDGASWSATLDLPSPEKAEAGTMPGNDRRGLNDGQRRAAVAPDTGQSNPQQAIRWGSASGVFSRSAEGCRFGGAEPGSPAAGPRANERSRTDCKECRERNEHRRREL
jgi:hypothetical protein